MPIAAQYAIRVPTAGWRVAAQLTASPMPGSHTQQGATGLRAPFEAALRAAGERKQKQEAE